MRKQELELRVLDIVERVAKGQPIEDDTVELKAEWPQHHLKAARRIAAHANTARGEPILWLIGVDEKQGVVGADFEELSRWYFQVRGCFDEHLAPDLVSLAVPWEGMTVVALLFETDRAPFVIRTSAIGPITHEVPWREANSTRSARRADLLKLLVPIQKTPKIDVLDGAVSLYKMHGRDKQAEHFQWQLNVRLYIITYSSETVVIPFHTCKVAFRGEHSPDEAYFENITITPPTTFHARELKEKVRSLTVSSTESEVLINTAGLVHLQGEITTTEHPRLNREIRIKAMLTPHHSELPAVIQADFAPVAVGENEGPRLLARWQIRLQSRDRTGPGAPATPDPHEEEI
ncbi:MAG: hypothetical protein GX442_15125 [Candidatus Riflebacteria bacterium]|nr:hypothetical protein [Candidatus Riflebacteria bacterium]